MILSKTIIAFFFTTLNRVVLLLLLMGLSICGFSQMNLAANLNVTKGAYIHFSNTNETVKASESQLTKIYVVGDAKIVNLAVDHSLVEIVYTQPSAQSKKEKIQPVAELQDQVIAKKEVEPAPKKEINFFLSRGNTSTTLFYSTKITRGLIVPSSNFTVKILDAGINSTVYSYFLNIKDVKSMDYQLRAYLVKKQDHLENPITRPPPFPNFS